jgi:hypothetical protein
VASAASSVSCTCTLQSFSTYIIYIYIYIKGLTSTIYGNESEMKVFYQCLKWILKKIKRKRKYLTTQSCGAQVNLTPKVTFPGLMEPSHTNKHTSIHLTISIWSVSVVKTLPCLFLSSTPTTWQASFWSFDSGSRFYFKLRCLIPMIWSMGGRAVDREGWHGLFGK